MKIGKIIRDLRKKSGQTLEELSQKSGVALATLSRIENDKMTGTLESHKNICKALNTSITDLYREIETESKTVDSVSASSRIEYFKHSEKAKYELLVNKVLDKKIMPLLINLDVGGKTQEEINKTGVEKFVYLLEGNIEALVGEQLYTLESGDSIYFDASLSHVFKNKGKKQSKAICIVTPSTQ